MIRLFKLRDDNKLLDGIQISKLASALTLIPSFFILISWYASPRLREALFFSLPAMVPWTCALLSALAIPLVRGTKSKSALIFNLAAAVSSGVFLAEYLFHFDFQIDRLLFFDFVKFDTRTEFPGRPSPQTSVAILALSLAQLCFRLKRYGRSVWLQTAFQMLSAFAGAVSLVALVGYIYQIAHLFGFSKHVGMAVLTATNILFLTFATFSLDGERGLFRAMTAQTSSGFFIRTFAIGGIGSPFLIAGFIRWGEIRNWIAPTYGMALFVLFAVSSNVALSFYVSRKLVQIENQKRSIETKEIEVRTANEANSAKDKFLANISHELRTPLMAILGYIDCAKDRSLDASEREDFCEKAERSSKSLLRVLDDVLDISKIDAARLMTSAKPFRIKVLVEDVLAVVSREADKKQILLKTSFSQNLPDELISDSYRIRQILVNLASNAVKFTSEGCVSLNFSFENFDSGTGGHLVVDIIDTGIGIALDKQSKLFETFYQVDDSVTRRFGGTGLGLAISRKLATLLKGELALVSSTENFGSTFRLRLPVQSVMKSGSAGEVFSATPDISSPSLDGLSILVVDDNLDNQFLIKRYLTAAGADVEVADNGQIGVDMASAKPYSLILMDIQMPVLGGLEAVSILRHNGFTNPIVALSAHAMTEHLNQSLEAGCNAHMTKPISKTSLIQIVHRYAIGLRLAR